MTKCYSDGTEALFHVLIWFPNAYIISWGIIVVHRRWPEVIHTICTRILTKMLQIKAYLAARRSTLSRDQVDTEENDLSAVPVYMTRQTTASFLDEPGSEELRGSNSSWFRGTLDSITAPPIDPLKLPTRDTRYCMSPGFYKAVALFLQVVISVTDLIDGIYILQHKDEVQDSLSSDSNYVGAVLIVEYLVWAWCTLILWLAPASSSCTVPIFWVMSYCRAL